MNWKIWTWPKRMCNELADLHKQPAITSPPLPVTPHDLERLKARVGGLAKDDPLWPMLMALLRSNLNIEVEQVAKTGIGDEEAHRGRGRIGMLLELEAQLEQVWRETHLAE